MPAVGTRPTLPQRRILEAMRDGATIQADRPFPAMSRRYVVTPPDGYEAGVILPWLPVQSFCGLVDGGWVEDKDGDSMTYTLTETGRNAVT